MAVAVVVVEVEVEVNNPQKLHQNQNAKESLLKNERRAVGDAVIAIVVGGDDEPDALCARFSSLV